MWQTIIIWIIVALCAFFIGRKYLRQWRSAVTAKNGNGCAESSCGCCSISATCRPAKEIKTTQPH